MLRLAAYLRIYGANLLQVSDALVAVTIHSFATASRFLRACEPKVLDHAFRRGILISDSY